MLSLYCLRDSKHVELPVPGPLPFVTIQLPVYNERYVIERLINAVSGLDYPKHLFEIQLLDDSTDDTSAIIRKKITELSKDIQIVHIRRTGREGYKAGALQNGLSSAKGEFIAIFDADFVPEPSFLKKTLSCFLNPGIGMVQTRWGHLNARQSVLTKAQQFALDGHFNIEQQGRYRAGAFINFCGTAGIWRKQCIEESGGWQYDTLTEDLDLSYRAQLKGWKFVYCEEVITPAELPADMNAIRSQQFRWIKGGAETALKLLPQLWKSNHPFFKKMSGTLHLMSNYIYLLIFLTGVLSIPLLLLASVSPVSRWHSFYSVLCSMLLTANFIFYYVSLRSMPIRNRMLTLLRSFPLFISVSFGMSLHNSMAVLQALAGKKTSFIRTPKFNSPDNTGEENTYRMQGLKSIFFIEALMSLYFLSGAWIAWQAGNIGLVLFYITASAGFAAVSGYSIAHSLPGKVVIRQ